MPADLFTTFAEPVVLVTKGRGREVFTSSSRLFKRLEELPRLKEQILQIDHGTKTLSADSIAGLETMLWLCGFHYFRTATKRAPRPSSRFGTKYNWAFLCDYLGFDWRDKREAGR